MRLTLGGAQIAVELTESWLNDSTSRVFAVQKIAPVYMSQHGFENLAKGLCDMACTDRPLTVRELERFEGKPVVGRRVAFYGYALYVNMQNPLDSIFAKHLQMVLRSRIKDWSEIVGPDVAQPKGPVSVYGPPKGTRGGQLMSHLARIWFADATWTELPTDAEIVKAVAADPLALGVASIGYDQGVRYMGLRMERMGAPAFPSIEEIESERYGLAKVFYLYYISPPTPQVQALLDYLASDAGRRAIDSTGLWAIPPERGDVPLPQ